MWLSLNSNASQWLELGTSYDHHVTENYGYVCVYSTCDFLFQEGLYTDVGAHTWKIDRNNTNHNVFDFYIDGTLADWISSTDTSGSFVEAGLETYNQSVTVEATAYYTLKYAVGDGSFQDWAGEDAQTGGFTIMCGKWHLATSWWAGEHTSCN